MQIVIILPSLSQKIANAYVQHHHKSTLCVARGSAFRQHWRLVLLLALLESMRPRQWPKNGFAFVPLLFDGNLALQRVLTSLLAFGLLCLMSSAVYLMNDLSDVEEDRQHPVKRNRPIPSGRLNTTVAIFAAILFALGSASIAFTINTTFALVLLGYLIVQIAYTFQLKHVVLLDVSIIATGFIMRIAAGATAIDVRNFSPWLYIFGGFLALFMILGKRRHELILLGDDAGKHRAVLGQYSVPFIDILIGIVTTSCIVSYSLYTFLSEGLPPNNLMMLTIPCVIYGMFRYLYLIHIEHQGGAPEEILLRDRPTQIDLVIWLIIVFFAIYVPTS